MSSSAENRVCDLSGLDVKAPSVEQAQSMRRRIVLLGASGSIGQQTLDVIRKHPDRFELVGLSVHTNVALLQEAANEFGVSQLCITDEAAYDQASQGLALSNPQAQIGFGQEGILELCRLEGLDVVVNALVGASGVRASYETLIQNKVLALANKESLVVAGDLIMPLATPQTLLPIDSEHGAIYQCLVGERKDEISRLWITASGGPFRGKSRQELAAVSPQDALAHPTWKMGPKITIDSSTLMNKGLEVIEAHHLFGMPYDFISVVVQPQSAIHSLVEFIDGSVKAHMGTTDMRIPIQYALSFPERLEAPCEKMDFCALGSLDFEAPAYEVFPCLSLAYRAGKAGGVLPCVMNAANEIAVAAFLDGSIGYLSIARIIKQCMDEEEASGVVCAQSIDQLMAVDARVRLRARQLLESHRI